MKSNQLIDLVLRPHDVSIILKGPWGQETEVTVAFPDLRTAPRSVWGDWGPMYSVAVPSAQPIALTARTRGSATSTRQVLDLGRLEVESPELAAIRDATPLFLDLPLATEGMRLRIYYDVRGHAARAELVPILGSTLPRSLYAVEVKTALETTGGGRARNRMAEHHAAE